MKTLLDSIKARLPQGHFGKSVFLLAGGTALGQGLVLLSSPLLTRLFSPADFGILAAYASTLTIISTVAAMRYEQAIALPKEDREAMSVMVLAFLLLLGTTTLLCLALYLFRDLAAPAKLELLRKSLWLLPIGFFGAGSYQILSFWAVRKKMFKTIANTKVSQGAGLVLTQLTLGYLRVGSVGLITGDIIGRMAGVFTIAAKTVKEDWHLLRQVTWRELSSSFSRYRHFFTYGSCSAMFNIAGLQLPGLLLTLVFDPMVAGWFALSQRIIGGPMRLVGSSVAQVYLSESSRLAHSDCDKVRELFHATSKKLFLYGSGPLIVLGLLGPLSFELIFGAGWAETGYYVALLVPMYLMQFIVSPLSQNSMIFEKQGKQFIWDLVRVVVVALVLLSPRVLHLSHYGVIMLYSGVMSVMYMGQYLFYRNIIPAGAGEVKAT